MQNKTQEGNSHIIEQNELFVNSSKSIRNIMLAANTSPSLELVSSKPQHPEQWFNLENYIPFTFQINREYGTNFFKNYWIH